ncbi:MAG: ABC transporter ATP-binding protein [Bacteroidetes bacterium]|nr:MAG: ABC transporter ATP-binding protein [Bacteroidota bacterium]
MKTQSTFEQDYILEVNHLTVQFHGDHGILTALNDVSFKIRRGETVGLVGESGSGKSVSALSMMRLLPQNKAKVLEGEIIFHSPTLGKVNLLRLNNQQIRNLRGGEMAMIFQDPMTSLNPVFTCGEQVVETILKHQKNISYQQAKQKTLELFEKVRLPRIESIFKNYPHEISGGQKQRIMIAMALACHPALLIADEPTTALDVTVQHSILELLQELREDKNISVLFITHDLSVISEIADSVLVMYKGEVVEDGNIWDTFANPKHPYTKGLLACRPRVDMKLKVLPVINDFMITDDEGKIKSDETRFKSVGQAIMMNYQSPKELKERHDFLLKQTKILEVKNLKIHFPQDRNFFGKVKSYVKPIENLSFDVYKGETLGLVGESGCGKTTLSRVILGLLAPNEGEILFEGENILTISPKKMQELRRDIQIIFQDPYSSLNPKMTVGETIMEPMQIHNIGENNKERKEKVVELLETVGLNGAYLNRYPHEFSGGQMQRISIARTLSLTPKFIICDESVSALDVSVQAQVLNLLNRLKEKYNLTYIFISHDLSVIKFISDRIMVMNAGKIEEIGFGEDIYHQPKQEYTRQLIESIPKGSLENIRKAMLKRKMGKVVK